MLRKKKFLVTGAGGFVGSRLIRQLVQDHEEVVAVVNDLSTSSIETLQGSTLCLGDVTDFDFVRRLLSNYEIDVVFHFAASAIVRISALDPVTTYRTNVMGTLNVLEAARQIGRCSKIIVASSDKAYGDHESLPYREWYPLLPKNTYDTSKACADLIAQNYESNYGLPVIVTRSSNIFGPGDRNTSRLIPGTILRLFSGQPPVLYDGIENMMREFVYIDDVVRAYRLLADVPSVVSGIFNIGGTGPRLIKDVVTSIQEIMGLEHLQPEFLSQRSKEFKEIFVQYTDASKIRDATGWIPTTDFREGLEKTVEWYTKR